MTVDARPPRGRADWELLLGGTVAVLTVSLLLASEIAATADARPTTTRLTLVLVALGLLCVLGIAGRRSPTVAWLAAVLGSGIAAIDVMALARGGEFGGAGWLVAELGRMGLFLVTILYLASRVPDAGTARVAWGATLGFAIAVVAVEIAAVAAGLGVARPLEIDEVRLASRVLLGWVGVATLSAAGLDLRPALDRARRRLAMDPPGSGADWLRLISYTVDEAMPFGANRRRLAEAHERSRLARDLHASVLPELRTALAASSVAGGSSEVGRRVAAAVGELEQLMVARQPVVVDALGLIRAVEWLAERDQERFGIAIELEVEVDDGPTDLRPPVAVERAAFRVAQLALDNAGRHSGADSVDVRIGIGPDAVSLRVTDQGRGFVVGPSSGQGIADMRAEAARAGASIDIDGRGGTTVAFAWSRVGRSRPHRRS